MQFCIVFAVLASLVAAEFVPRGDVALMMPKIYAVIICQLLIVLIAQTISTQTVADVVGGKVSRESIVRRLDRGYRVHLAAWFLVAFCTLGCFDWIRIVGLGWSKFVQLVGWPELETLPLIVRMGVLLPLVLPLLVSWACLYDAERSLDTSLQNSTRFRYVLNQARLYLFLPVGTVLAVVGWSEMVLWLWPTFAGTRLATTAQFLPLVGLLFGFPLLLRRIWSTQPLAAGPLRTRLEQRSEQVGFALSDILIWHTQHRMSNAAVSGIVPQLRYLLLTDRLVDSMPGEQVELVLLHEVAHAKCRHSVKLMLALGGALAAACLLAVSARANLAVWLPTGSLFLCMFLLLVSGMAVSLWLVGHFARLFELQADTWAAEESGDTRRYLSAVAAIAGGGPDKTTWLHPSFARRCEFLSNGVEEATVTLRYRLRLAATALGLWIAGAGVFSALLASG